ncbi:peptide chain release factor N(5)-glutamine methyltransferase [Crocosphaera sp. XPORK-15E]|uniref:peptide chain release factor N(5)-glutamine methyltransferase n=1 Tax=Crocosphaera sp. XPORK-15E TaxID=3110247 RepID=UPI002B1ED0AD|nr:peptide chain release factor N(5)-glutamine methyltransferase [Crocosphaera sp. XPORK-15E]MEA5533286.1 peptide chain release factor N(5)-glutamine methyltransferase [Crocosphaera sp. XPORK-15E]
MVVGFSVSGQALDNWRNWAKQAAIDADIDPTEVDWLLQEIAQLDAFSLRLNSFLGRSQIPLKLPLSELTQLWQRRLKERVPVQYLAGVTPWRNFSLKVSPSVLIPRPETELIIDFALKASQESLNPHLVSGNWVDLGTGSGAIAVGLAEIFPEGTIHAVDTSREALAIAQENAANLGFFSKIDFYHGSWWSPLINLKGKVSGMVSNPPYIPTGMLSQLQPEVRQHEPYLALDGGLDGLESIQYLIETAPDYLVSGGVWLIEMMAGQGEIVAQLLEDSPYYQGVKILPDLAGIERFALAYRC